MKTKSMLIPLLALGLTALASKTAAVIPVSPGQSIQAALDIASATPGPDVIVINAGTYDERLIIEDADPVLLKGAGEVIIAGSDPEEATISVLGGCATLSQLTITSGDDGIQAIDCQSLVLNNLLIINTGDEGVDAENCAEVTMIHCRVIESGDHGIQLEVDPELVAGTATIIGSEFMDNDGDGIKAEDLASVLVIDCTCDGDSDGLDLDGVDNILLRNTTASGNEDEGLEVDGAQSVEVVQGGFFANEGEGMDLDDVIQVTITAVTCAENQGSGLQVTAESVDAMRVRIVNGRFEANLNNGIEMLEEEALIQSVELIAVVAQDNENHGLFLDITGALSSYNVISRNNGLADVLP